jgi:DNA-binding transcriptional ArsR family regulator
MEETTINISLNDENSKNIIEVLGNETCKKILNLLAEKEYTETEISQKLKISLNTVDYNIKKLIKASLIESSSHWWSTKGKKMPSYKVSNRQIIISPRKFSSKVLLLPLLIFGGALSFGVKKFIEIGASQDIATNLVQESAPALMTKSIASDLAPAGVTQLIPTSSGLAGWEWFLIGIWSGIILFFIFSYIYERRFSK